MQRSVFLDWGGGGQGRGVAKLFLDFSRNLYNCNKVKHDIIFKPVSTFSWHVRPQTFFDESLRNAAFWWEKARCLFLSFWNIANQRAVYAWRGSNWFEQGRWTFTRWWMFKLSSTLAFKVLAALGWLTARADLAQHQQVTLTLRIIAALKNGHVQKCFPGHD